MFTITQDEFNDIMSILGLHCAFECPKKGMPCRVSNCDIGKIYDILYSHLESDFPEEDDLPF